MDKLTHTDDEGRAKMVDVSTKPSQHRVAKAKGFITLQEQTVALIKENRMKKGDVLTVAELAGIQAAKRTSELIPLCHPLPITNVEVTAHLEDGGVSVTATVSCVGQTGVELEALCAVSVALLTVYDMCKAVDKKMKIGDIILLEKTKSG
ncbi:MAG: cyclic pyranopterin monophosphate synthase MoaC [bacterium]|nr:MAG: cyclic pyranopterin monophosphate synthase MoaC [bacterium]